LEVFIEEKALIAVSEAPDLPALKSAWSSLPFYDLPLEAIYWTHVGELEHSADSEKALLKTIPRSPLEFAYLYALNDTKAWSSSPALVRLYEEYFESLAKAAAKHEEYIKPLLMMSRFADGEAKNSTDQANEFLKKLNLSGYLRALRRLDTQSRRSVCGDCPELAQESRKP
jgi:hypothetical protein